MVHPAPRLGQYLAIDATDIPAWAKYRSPHCNAPDKENCTQKHKRHCDDPDRKKCSKHSSKPCADSHAMLGYRTPKGRSGTSTANDGEDAKELFFGYKAHVIADAIYGIPLHITLRPANENETSHFAQTPTVPGPRPPDPHNHRLTYRSARRGENYTRGGGIERWFASAKRSRLLYSHQHLAKAKIELQAEMSMLASLLTTLTHPRANDYEHMRRMTIKLS